MILNPSHLFLNVPDIDRAMGLMDDLKSRLLFSDDVSVSQSKQAVLHELYTSNRVRYFGFDGDSCEIEVMEHTKPSRVNGNIFPLFGTASPVAEDKLVCVEQVFERVTGKQVQTSDSNGIVTFHQADGTGNGGVRMILCFAENLDRKADFFIKALEFKDVGSGEGARTLQCTSKISKSRMTLCLKKAETQEEKGFVRPQFIDDVGFTGMSFLVNNLERHLKKISQAGFGSSLCDMEVTVNGKEVLCSFLRDPEGQLIELFQFKNIGKNPKP